MIRLRTAVFPLVTLLALAAFGLAQGKYRQQAQRGPYRVFMSKPVLGLSYTAPELYREHEYLGAMFNDLAAKGMRPIFTEVTTHVLPGEPPATEQRLLVVCVPQ